jgi:hypothetical protein
MRPLHVDTRLVPSSILAPQPNPFVKSVLDQLAAGTLTRDQAVSQINDIHTNHTDGYYDGYYDGYSDGYSF